eukprot:TRINITY_DN12744_c0_g2_i1.p1 TRINITY_DN12744_c0_g2~~TRINITY_DN12744_c0_g2_i1.p1  ORF type:complete len:363 (+),score=45.11 TRINITY_DN12744_c0_g2_i1:89-1177(+)
MGTKQRIEDVQNGELSKHHFQFVKAVGRGAFGRVWKVIHKARNSTYALKELSKARILMRKNVHTVLQERYLLESVSHPFLVNMYCAFQDQDTLYLVMDWMPGGDLRYQMNNRGLFTEEETKYVISSLIIALEYLHSKGILHRDVKPENLVFGEQGHLRLTDLGIAQRFRQESARDTSGTPGYMAPEVILREDHGIAADYFAVGVITHELMTGRLPYDGDTQKDIRDAILHNQVEVTTKDVPTDWTPAVIDFINKTIRRRPETRLGAGGAGELKRHPWFRGFDWRRLARGAMPGPFVPNCQIDNFDAKFVNRVGVASKHKEQIQENKLLLRRDSVQNLFLDYGFLRPFPVSYTHLTLPTIYSV